MARIYIVDYQYQLVEAGEPQEGDGISSYGGPPPPGFSQLRPGSTYVRTGTDTGSLDIDLTIHEHMPAPLPDWEEVYDAEQVTTTGEIMVWSLNGGTSEPPLPRYVAAPGSRFAIRLHVSGRVAGQAAGIVEGEAVERHHLQLWPVVSVP